MQRRPRLHTAHPILTLGFAWLLAISTLALSAHPAAATEEDGQLWIGAVGHVELPAEWRGHFLVQTRFSDNIDELERVLLNPSVSRALGHGIAAAFGYDAHMLKEPKDRTEHRAWQQLAFDHDAWTGKITHRLRLEERFLKSVDGSAVRLRHMLRGAIPLPRSQWKAIVSNEVFLDLNSKRNGPSAGFGENRFFVGAAHALSAGVLVEAGYQLQFVDRRADNLAAHAFFVTLNYGP